MCFYESMYDCTSFASPRMKLSGVRGILARLNDAYIGERHYSQQQVLCFIQQQCLQSKMQRLGRGAIRLV